MSIFDEMLVQQLDRIKHQFFLNKTLKVLASLLIHYVINHILEDEEVQWERLIRVERREYLRIQQLVDGSVVMVAGGRVVGRLVKHLLFRAVVIVLCLC